MKTRLVLKPGQRGTKRLVDRYGENLVCVRYRYDEHRKKRIKTVELAIEEVSWEPEINHDVENPTVGIRVGPEEKDVQNELRTAGGVWNRKYRFWEIDLKSVERMGMTDRIVSEKSG